MPPSHPPLTSALSRGPRTAAPSRGFIGKVCAVKHFQKSLCMHCVPRLALIVPSPPPPTTSRVLTAGSLPQPEPLVSPGSFHNPCYPCYIPGDCTAGLYPLGEPETDADSATAKGMCEQAGLSSATLALPATTDSSLTSASVRLLSLGLCGNTCAFGK